MNYVSSGYTLQTPDVCRVLKNMELGGQGLRDAVVAPMPWLVGNPHRGIFRIGQDKSEPAGVFKKPLIFRQSLEFTNVCLSVDAVRVNEVDCQMFRVPMLAVAGQSDPFRGFADRVIMVAKIVEEEIKLMGA